jgi:hypothetical protein
MPLSNTKDGKIQFSHGVSLRCLTVLYITLIQSYYRCVSVSFAVGGGGLESDNYEVRGGEDTEVANPRRNRRRSL